MTTTKTRTKAELFEYIKKLKKERSEVLFEMRLIKEAQRRLSKESGSF